MNHHQDVPAESNAPRRVTSLLSWALVVAVATMVVPSCKKGTDSNVPLTDPVTGQVIGHKDPATGKYMFNNGLVVTPQPEQAIAPDVVEALAAKMTPKPMFKTPSRDSHGGFASGSGSVGCTGGCWRMVEGSVGCEGCCTPAGGGACSCWERCWDVQRSSSGPAK
jgi:hypothetical protein